LTRRTHAIERRWATALTVRDERTADKSIEAEKSMAFKRTASVVVLALSLVSVTACAGRGGRSDGPAVFTTQSNDGGFNPFRLGRGGGKSTANQAAIGVNAYLWRATLDTLAFMPLASADPYGGVIITDWYAAPETPNERFKATVYILDTRLRADGLNVTVFKQVNQGGQWVDAPTSAQTETDIENAILTRARQLRLSNIR
jgi:hypothetical protein